AIVIIIASGSMYYGTIIRNSFQSDAINLITQTHLLITAELQEPETLAIVVAYNIREILTHGGGAAEVREYIDDLSDVMEGKESGYRFFGIHAYLDQLETYIPAAGWHDVPDDFYVYDRPWYVAGIEAGGEVTASPIYISLRHGGHQISYVTQIFDDSGESLGVVAVNAPITRIVELVSNMRLSETAFGFLADENFNIVAHSHEAFIGINVLEMNTSFGQIAAVFALENAEIIEIEDYDYRGERTMFYVEAIENGWYLGLGAPVREYFRDYRAMMAFVGTLGVFVIIAISAILIHMDKARNKAARAYNEQLISAKEIAENSNRSKGAFIAQMSHEIRTPMNAILGISEIQLHDTGLTANAEEGFRQVYESGTLLLNIINDILDFSKIDAGKLEITPNIYDIPSLVNDAMQLTRLRNESKLIEFHLNIDENTPLEMIGDETRIRQILNNLLSNSFKYTDHGEVRLDISAEVIPGNPNIILVISVSDTGQGMTEEQIKEIFIDYSRFNTKENYNVTGTGLGMSITKRLLDLMDGEINVESEVDSGSVFTVRLPQKRVGTSVCGAEVVARLRDYSFRPGKFNKKAQLIHEYMPYGKVLIVDDVESNLYVAKGLLMPYGLQIETVKSGFEAIDKIEAGNEYDIIFMDHMMPKMDGIEATNRIREMGYSNAIVALTANAIVGNANMFLSNGFNEFLPKPVDSRDLDSMLKTLIRDNTPPEVLEAARLEQKKKVSSKENNLSDLHKYTAVDAENTINVLKGFMSKSNDITDADYNAYTTAVHGMKSALMNIGEHEMSDIALKLERAGDTRNLTVIFGETASFIESLQLLVAKLKPSKTEDSAETELSEEEKTTLTDNLNDLIKASRTFDIKTMETILSALKKKPWPDKINSHIEEMFMALIKGEYKNITKGAEELMSAM
ncbi:MAG: ATP-binding protein, partial [Oscillospiraceae bacterium]|nr:ATP-binding protein [Oscillospiraceae bacterium]